MDAKQKTKLILAGVATGLVMIVLLVLAFLRMGDATTSEQQYNDKVDMLTSSYAARPYPNKANREIVIADIASAKKICEEAKACFYRTIEIPEGESPSDFTRRIRDVVQALNARQNANLVRLDAISKGKEEEAATTELNYSFDAYLSGALPSEEHLTRLATQFAFIENFTEMLLTCAGDNNVLITEVKREVFDKQEKKEEQKPRRSSNRNKKKEVVETNAFGSTPMPSEISNDGVTRESFSFSFRTRYDALAKLLNMMRETKTFWVVNSVKVVAVQSIAKEVEARQSKNVKGKSTSRRARAKAEEAAKDEIDAINRLVPTPATAGLVDVTLVFDVYTAEPPVQEEANDEAPAKEGE